MIDIRWSRQAGMIENLGERSARLYRIWLERIGLKPRRETSRPELPRRPYSIAFTVCCCHDLRQLNCDYTAFEFVDLVGPMQIVGVTESAQGRPARCALKMKERAIVRRVKVIYLELQGSDDRWKKSFIEVFGDKHDWSIYDLTQPTAPQFADAEVVIDMGGVGMTPVLVAASTQCTLWHILAVGYDIFDMSTMRQAGIAVANVPGSTSAEGLANGAIMFMLQILIKYNAAQETLRSGKLYTPMGEELDGKILGMIGFGASGQALAKVAKVFGMQFMIVEPMTLDQATLDTYTPNFVGGADAMDKVIGAADFVSLHLPLNDDTRGIIDARRIALMNPNASFINVARGDLVDQDALYAALLEGRIRGIGTDVHTGRYPDKDHPVYQHPDFYALPHVSGTTVGTAYRRAEAALENVNRIAEGLEPKWRVDDR